MQRLNESYPFILIASLLNSILEKQQFLTEHVQSSMLQSYAYLQSFAYLQSYAL